MRRPVVVLDDDPTGTQTLRDVTVLTAWSDADIESHLDEPVLFLSTNSRSLHEPAAVALAAEATRAAMAAGARRGVEISLVSRSDSTLRGHFPAEPLAIASAAGRTGARILLAPFFGEGGRVTAGDIHYLVRGGKRVPVGETEFAADPVFGYRSSNLREWVAENYAAAGLGAPPIASLDLELVRAGASAVAQALLSLPDGAVAIANAESDPDIEAVAQGALLAEKQGLPLVARTAASYVRARAGRQPTALLEPDDLPARGPGVVLVGSHVPTTTRQLERLLARLGDDVAPHELAIDELLNAPQAAAQQAAAAIDHALAEGRTAVGYTPRARREVALEAGRRLSIALAACLPLVNRRPAWVVAKGGITSSDVALHGLGMREARVAGQLLPGVPVWIGGESARWPGMPLVVFPGNVGDDEALAEAVSRLC